MNKIMFQVNYSHLTLIRSDCVTKSGIINNRQDLIKLKQIMDQYKAVVPNEFRGEVLSFLIKVPQRAVCCSARTAEASASSVIQAKSC